MSEHSDEERNGSWDADSIQRLFAESDEITRSLLSYLARPENTGGVRTQQVAKDLDLRQYLRKVIESLRKRCREEFGRRSPVRSVESGGNGWGGRALVMNEDVAEFVRRAETMTASSVSTAPRPSDGGAMGARLTATDEGGRDDETVRVYEAGASVRIRPLAEAKAIWERRRFLSSLARTELKAQHFNTALGQVWLVLEPISLALMYTFLFMVLRGGATEPGRVQLIMSGIFLFVFTRTSVQNGARSVIKNESLLLNSSFPLMLLPTATVLEAFLQLLPGLVVYGLVHVATGQPVGVGLLVLPGLLLLHSIFNLGVAMAMATVTVYLRDIQNLLGYVMRLWMYSTPVLYPVSDLRGNLDAFIAILKWANPLWSLFDGYQRILAGGFPTVSQVSVAGAWSLVMLVGGFLLFSWKDRFIAIRL